MGNMLSLRKAIRIGLVVSSAAAVAVVSTSNVSIARPVHLLSYSCYFGTSVWVTFFAGIIAFKTLPRHMFGKMQSQMFPVYFAFQTACLGLTLAARSVEVPPDSLTSALTARRDLQLIGSSLLISVANLIWLEPKTTALMFKRHVIERELGTGHEVGQLKPSDPKKANDPRLVKITKEFGMYHGISASVNLLALCTTAAYGTLYLVE